MRGDMYEICTEIGDIGNSQVDGLDLSTYCDYTEPVDGFGRNMVLSALFMHLCKCGAEHGIVQEEGCEVHYLNLNESVKKGYFRTRYKQFVKIATEMTLTNFSADVAGIKQVIEEEYADMVYEHDFGTMTIDEYIRKASIGVRLYFGKVICLK